MIFGSERARDFLLKNGVVFTFRVRRRKRLGEDWAVERGGGRKIADIVIEEEIELAPSDLWLYHL